MVWHGFLVFSAPLNKVISIKMTIKGCVAKDLHFFHCSHVSIATSCFVQNF